MTSVRLAFRACIRLSVLIAPVSRQTGLLSESRAGVIVMNDKYLTAELAPAAATLAGLLASVAAGRLGGSGAVVGVADLPEDPLSRRASRRDKGLRRQDRPPGGRARFPSRLFVREILMFALRSPVRCRPWLPALFAGFIASLMLATLHAQKMATGPGLPALRLLLVQPCGGQQGALRKKSSSPAKNWTNRKPCTSISPCSGRCLAQPWPPRSNREKKAKQAVAANSYRFKVTLPARATRYSRRAHRHQVRHQQSVLSWSATARSSSKKSPTTM